MNGGNKNNILLIALILLAFVAGSLWNRVQTLEKGGTAGTNNPQVAGAEAGQPTQPPTEVKIRKPDPKTDHWKGDKNARFVMVENSDLECPFCKSWHPTAQRLLDENKGQVAWVFRNFPLSFHQNAQKEAEAAECVADLGGNDKYWKFVDTIFERTTSNGTGFALDKLGPLAKEVGVDQNKFQDCLDSDKFAKKVQDDLNKGSAEGVAATPTTVIYDMKTGNTKVIEGALPYESAKATLDELMKG